MAQIVRREPIRKATAARTDLAGRLKPRSARVQTAGDGLGIFQFKWAEAVSEQEWAVYSQAPVPPPPGP